MRPLLASSRTTNQRGGVQQTWIEIEISILPFHTYYLPKEQSQDREKQSKPQCETGITAKDFCVQDLGQSETLATWCWSKVLFILGLS